MLVAIFYPIFDGGLQQIRDVYRGLRGHGFATEGIQDPHGKGGPSKSPSSRSVSDTTDSGEARDKA